MFSCSENITKQLWKYKGLPICTVCFKQIPYSKYGCSTALLQKFGDKVNPIMVYTLFNYMYLIE